MAIPSELIAAIVLAGGTVPPASPAAIAATQQEAALLARTPAGIRRAGDSLIVDTSAGDARFRTTNCDGADDRCTAYWLDRLWARGKLVGIRIGLWEGGDYLVIDRAGRSTLTGTRPTLSPGARWLASASAADGPEGGDASIRIFDAATLAQVHAVGRGTLAGAERPAWQGADCLTFIAPSPDARPGARRWWLRHDAGIWHLAARRPRNCR